MVTKRVSAQLLADEIVALGYQSYRPGRPLGALRFVHSLFRSD